MKTKIVVLAAILILLTGVVFAQEEGWTPSVGFQYSLGMSYNSVTGGEYDYGFNSGSYVGASYSGENFDAQVQARLEGVGPFLNQLWVTWKPTEVVSLRAGLTDPVTAYYSGLAYKADGNWAYGATAGDTVLGLKLAAYGAYISLWDPNPGHVPLRQGYNAAKNIGDFAYPAVAIGYDWANDTFSVGGGIAGAPVDTRTVGAPYLGQTGDETEIAFIFYLHGRVNIGDLYVALNAGFEKAAQQFFLYSANPNFIPGIGNGGVKDYTIEGFLEAGYNTPIGALAGTVALVQTINDGYDNGTALQAGVSLSIPLTDNIAISPGVIYQNLLVSSPADQENWEVLGGVTFTVAF
jgi:hypothetical protein